LLPYAILSNILIKAQIQLMPKVKGLKERRPSQLSIMGHLKKLKMELLLTVVKTVRFVLNVRFNSESGGQYY